MVIVALFMMAIIWKQTTWVNKEAVYVYTHTHTHAHNGLFPRHEKNSIFPFATKQIDLEGIILSEKHQRKTNTVWFLKWIWKTKQMKQSRNRLIDTENKLVVAREGKSRSLSETGTD